MSRGKYPLKVKGLTAYLYIGSPYSVSYYNIFFLCSQQKSSKTVQKSIWGEKYYFWGLTHGTGFACENHQNDINPPLLSKNGGRIYKIWTENSSKTASVPHRTVLKWLLSIKISSRLQKLCIKSHKFPTIRGKGEIGQKIIFQRHNYILWY